MFIILASKMKSHFSGDIPHFVISTQVFFLVEQLETLKMVLLVTSSKHVAVYLGVFANRVP